jgi:hypothetical protein
MHDEGKSDAATKYQINYIKVLMGAKEGYLLNTDLKNLSKGKASNLIQDLLYETNEKLTARNILKLKISLKPIKNDEDIKNFDEDSSKVSLAANVPENDIGIPSSIGSHTKIKYKVSGKLHLWGWTNFKDEINGRIIDYNTFGNVINSITYEVDKEIKDGVLQKYGLTAEKIG